MGAEIEPIYTAIGNAVMHARMRAGWTQQNLAGQVGLARASIANVELGRQRLMLHQVLALADALSIPVGALLGVGVSAQRETGTRKELRDEIVALRREVAMLRGALKKIAAAAADAAK